MPAAFGKSYYGGTRRNAQNPNGIPSEDTKHGLSKSFFIYLPT